MLFKDNILLIGEILKERINKFMGKSIIKKLAVISAIIVGALIVIMFYLIKNRTIIMNEEDYLTKLKELNKYSTDITMTF